MDAEKGIRRRLPPDVPEEQVQEEQEIEKRNVMRIRILSDNSLTIDGEAANFGDVKEKVMTFVDNPTNSDDLPEKVPTLVPLLGTVPVTDKHVIQLTAEREADYQVWFTVQNEIVSAYTQLRDDFSRRHFGQSYSMCNEAQREAARACYPQRVAEEYLRKKGGGL